MPSYSDGMNATTQHENLTERETSSYTRLSSAWLRKRRRLGLAPAYIRIGRRIIYKRTDLDALIQQGRIDPERVR